MKNTYTLFEETEYLVGRDIIFGNKLSFIMSNNYRGKIEGEYNFGSIRFKDKNNKILHIEYGLERVIFFRPATGFNSTKHNESKLFDVKETIGFYDFEQSTLNEIYLALLYVAKGIWLDKFKMPTDNTSENKFTYSTSEFNKLNKTNENSQGKLMIHKTGFTAKGPHPQPIHFFHGNNRGNYFDCAVLFKFRRITLEKFLHASNTFWFNN